ncbi:hypothetical protein [Paraburkholderia sp. C35]|uniref:hypothetical protein n=1 Tax=Paraburkholderia sp. C35 TaxID=2126993 RepID=UPI000D699E19|nr:hypothetical protein [Paraburkholderia sp. C35]
MPVIYRGSLAHLNGKQSGSTAVGLVEQINAELDSMSFEEMVDALGASVAKTKRAKKPVTDEKFEREYALENRASALGLSLLPARVHKGSKYPRARGYQLRRNSDDSIIAGGRFDMTLLQATRVIDAIEENEKSDAAPLSKKSHLTLVKS